jgi:hypothetical protein
MKLKQTVEKCKKWQIREDKNIETECHFEGNSSFLTVVATS